MRILLVGAAALTLERVLLPDAVAFPHVERIPPQEEEAVLEELEQELRQRAGRLTAREVGSIQEWAFHHSDDRLQGIVVVLDRDAGERWRPLIDSGGRLGLAVVLLGDGYEVEGRRLEVREGRLHIEAPGLGEVGELEACLLATEALEELAATGEPGPESEPKDVVPPAIQLGATTRLYCLGDLRVERDGEVQPPPNRRKARELVAFLAARPNATAEGVADALAGEESDPPSKDELKQWAHRARVWLRGSNQDGEASDVLVFDRVGRSYHLNPEALWVDVWAFEELLREAGESKDPEPSLRQAVDLYCGDFCRGLELWWAEEMGIRARLRSLFLEACARLAVLLEERKMTEDALRVVDRGLSVDFTNEALQRQSWRLLAELGRFDEVGTRMRLLRNRLEDELDVEPEEETEQLYRALMERRRRAARRRARLKVAGG